MEEISFKQFLKDKSDDEIESLINSYKANLKPIFKQIERFIKPTILASGRAFYGNINIGEVLLFSFRIQIAEKIIAQRKAGITPNYDYDLSPFKAIEIPQQMEITNEEIEELKGKTVGAEKHIISICENKTVQEIKEYISTLRRGWLLPYQLSKSILEKNKIENTGPFSKIVYKQSLWEVMWWHREINTAINILKERLKGTSQEIKEETVPTPIQPQNTLQNVTQEAPLPKQEAKETPQKKDEKPKTLFTTTNILIGGTIFLGIIYFVKNKK
jgi:hypothetical protein